MIRLFFNTNIRQLKEVIQMVLFDVLKKGMGATVSMVSSAAAKLRTRVEKASSLRSTVADRNNKEMGDKDNSPFFPGGPMLNRASRID